MRDTLEPIADTLPGYASTLARGCQGRAFVYLSESSENVCYIIDLAGQRVAGQNALPCFARATLR